MIFKNYLHENYNQLNKEIFRDVLSNNQVVKISKYANYDIFSCTKNENKKMNILSLDEYYNKKSINDPLIEHELDNLRIICENAVYRLEKMGISIKDNFNLIIADFSENKLLSDNKNGMIFIGKAFHEHNTIALDKTLLFKSYDEFEGVLVHETSHLIWELLPEKNKKWFIDWYQKNIIGELVRDLELTKEEINVIWEAFQKMNVIQPRKAINKTIPNLVLKVIEHKLEDSAKGLAPFKNAIIDSFTTRFRKNKDILKNEKDFKDTLSKIKFSGRPSSVSQIDASKLRTIAFEKGITPTEYAAYNFDELWAETIELMSDDKEVSKPLKSAIKKVISSLS